MAKPFEEKKRSFRFPHVEKIGQKVLEISGLSHGYNGKILFKVSPSPLCYPSCPFSEPAGSFHCSHNGLQF